MCKKLLISISLLFFAGIAYCQKSDVGNWFMYFGNQKISDKFNWHNEVQYRNYNLIGDMRQLLLRTGIGYNLTENNNNLLLGYGFINAQKYVGSSTQKIGSIEHRVYQQFITKQQFGRIFLQHRYRVEERFLTNDFQMRLRYFLGLNIPINQKTMSKGAVYISAYNEVFLNGQNTVFDHNRLYGAVGYVAHKNFRFELGFMNQAMQNTYSNQFQVAVFNSLSLKKDSN